MLPKNPYWYLVQKYPHRNWNWNCISEKIPIDIIEKHINDYPWDVDGIANNNTLTRKFVFENIELFKHSWRTLSRRLKFDYDFFKKIIAKLGYDCFDYDELSRNHTITLDFIEDNIDKLDCNMLSKNFFHEHRKITKKQHRQILRLCCIALKRFGEDLKRHIMSNYIYSKDEFAV